jgi:hypothetical protein
MVNCGCRLITKCKVNELTALARVPAIPRRRVGFINEKIDAIQNQVKGAAKPSY